MSPPASVTRWIGQLKAGDAAAAQPLFERYFQRLVGLARQRLRSLPRRAAADEEDVALHAFDSFCRDVQRGRFPQLADRDDLWRLLLTFTTQKAFDMARRERAERRGGGRAPDGGSEQLEWAFSQEPSPEFAAQLAEDCERLLQLLPDEEMRQLALWKMEGYNNEEIAARLGCVERTVSRRLQVIRALWTQPAQS